MSLSELIAECGDANVEFQVLANCLCGSQKQKKGYTEITFACPSVSLIELVSKQPKKIAFVVWLPADRVKAIQERLKA